MSELTEAREPSLGVCKERGQQIMFSFPKASGPSFNKGTLGDILQASISRTESFEVE